MTRIIRNLTSAFGAALLVAPAVLAAQPGPGARYERAGAITHLLNARRALDLTPRQIAQLDSLERIQYAERKQLNDRMRGARDSMMTRARSGERTPAARDSLRAQARTRMEAERPQMEQRRRRDSSMSAAAERVLNDTQRQKMREMMAEQRGFERGMRESQRPRGGTRDGMDRPQGKSRGGEPGRMGAPRGPGGPDGPRGPGNPGPRRPPADEPGGR